MSRHSSHSAGRLSRIFVHLLLLAIAAAFLFPFAWMILTSAKTDEEVAAGRWLPAMPAHRWESPYDTLDAAGKPVHATLDLLDLQLRSLDARIFDLKPQWKHVSGGKGNELRPTPDGAIRWHYRFPAYEEVAIEATFDAPIDPSNLHKLILSLKSDDSWHRVDAELTVGGTTWRSTRSTYLAQHRPLSVILQPPTFEDETYQPKIWVPLRETQTEISVPPDRERRAALKIILTPSSTPRALWGKLTRNYVRIFNSIPFWEYLFNSVLLVILTVTGTLFSATFVAYAFARLNWPGRSVALLMLLATLMLPEQVTMIPSFLIWQKLGWYNTLNPIWVPTFLGATFTPLFGSAFFIYLMVQHMKTLPKELEEAARIDGLNHVQTWWYVMLPQVKPAAAAVATLAFLAAWNDFLRPLIYLRDQGRFPLSLGLLTAQIENRGDWTMIMAGNVLMTLPVIVLFFVCQRYFVQGMTMSGMK
jgi:multiple sugar transport system permease protein